MHDPSFAIVPASRIAEPALRAFAAGVWGTAGWERVRKAWWLKTGYADAVAAVDQASEQVAGICVAVPSEWGLPDGRQASAVSICGWYVAPGFTGRGLGKMLVRSFEARASCMNALSISDAAVANFTKLGWKGPFSTRLRLLPLPAARRSRGRHGGRFSLASYEVSADRVPAEVAAALDRIDAERPASVLRRKRRSADWKAFLGACPTRCLRFHFIHDGARPVGYFVIRPTDRESGRVYRLARLHYVSDLVLNTEDDAAVDFVLDSIVAAAPSSAGALLLCATSEAVASAAAARGWMDERSPLLGQRLARKAPKYMVAGDFLPLAAGDFRLTFVDSDVDLNI